MPFIRKHRLVFVPLFVAVLAGAGLVFLLRSQSEEPAGSEELGVEERSGGALEPGGNVTPLDPAETVAEWQEDASKRTQHGREYKVTRTVEWVDPETEEVVTDTVVSTVRERGTNICCKDAADEWVPTVAEWEAGGLGFRMKRNSWQIDVPTMLGSAYDYTVGGRTLTMRPSVILLSDGTNTVSLGSLDTTVQGRIDPTDPSKLVFADALGANSGVDIELVLECAALHQNVVLRNKPVLPEGFNAENARLYVYTELGLNAYTADRAVSVTIADTAVDVSAANLATARNTDDPIAFSVQETVEGQPRQTVLHAFAESRVWDATGAANETRAARQLWRNPADSKTYLVESLPYAYIAGATGAVTLDYESVSGTTTGDEVWTADATYYVTGTVYVGGAKTLTIEPGTVVKFASGTSVYVTYSGAKIIAKGEPYNYIVFTSKNDDVSGEYIGGSNHSPAAGNYSRAINIGSSASADCVIEYCKIGYASYGIYVSGQSTMDDIQHCIVRNCTCGFYLYDSSLDVVNCLVTDATYGLRAYGYYNGTLDVVHVANCTFDNCTSYGVWLSASYGSPVIWCYVSSSLFSDNGYAVYKASAAAYGILDYNAYENNDVGGGLSKGAHAVDLDVSPYDTTNTQLGAYFIDTDGDGDPYTTDGSALVDAGTGSPYDDPSAFSIEPPEVVGSDIDESDTWSKRSGDTDDVDIGYHHPRVDKVISNAVRKIGATGSAVTLEIEPGVVVAFNGSDTRLQFDPDATATPTLLCDGLPAEPIVLAGKPLVSMWVEAQYINGSWSYPKAGVLLNDPTDEYTDAMASITYTRVIGLDDGIDIRKDSLNEIRHCTFERGEAALYGTGSDIDIVVSNCLMRDNRRGAIFKLNHAASSVELRNCTFDANGMGAVFQECNTAGLTILDCLFSNAEEGIRLWEDPDEYGSWTHDHNAFWNCGENNTKKIWLYYEDPQVQGDIGDNSIALDADPYDPAWFDDEDPASADWSAQGYLDQDGECIDAGSRSAVTAGLSVFTTRYDDNDYDYNAVDIGYHYATAVTLNKTHFDSEAAGDAGEIDISYDYGGNVTYRTISIYNSSGDLVYQTTEASSGTTISITWNGQGNQTGYSGDLATGAYTVVITGGAGNDEYTRFRVYIEQSADATLEITRPDSNETVDWL